ncbi:MAG: alternative ribosome rescue aminoacyl-tRNA hydrolase ArfB [Candidatus Latescibacterota bacterium]|nr:alternative ribosome rescue aminoacyl-tRNA hydrolase ArfB [Candidatus Latescibacterota bacterium]
MDSLGGDSKALHGNSGVAIAGGPVIPLTELQFSFAQSSGPGGQHVNRSQTRVELRFDVGASPSLDEEQRRRLSSRLVGRLNQRGELVLHSSRHRSQWRNRKDCVERLQQVLAEGLRPPPPPRRRTRPSRAAIARRLESKKRQSQKKRMRRRPGTG